MKKYLFDFKLKMLHYLCFIIKDYLKNIQSFFDVSHFLFAYLFLFNGLFEQVLQGFSLLSVSNLIKFISEMLNPESPSCISPRMMFSYDRGLNKSWNIPEYKTPRIYHDANLEVQKRKWAVQKKGEKNNKYVTKRGFYMDYQLKVAKSVPGSNTHQSQQPWSFKKEIEMSKHRKVDQKLMKNTYIQQIQNQQAKRKKPGIGTYSLEKSIKQQIQTIQKLKKVVRKTGEKRYFYEDTEHVSQHIPGSGNYNPHDSVQKLRVNKTNYKFWTDKHKKQYDRDHKRDLSVPTAGTYTPMSQSFQTFEKLLISPKKKLKNGFGTDARFPYIRPDKKTIKEVRPSPNSYNTGMSWRGKNYNEKTKQWHEGLWKGSMTESIYR